MLLSPYILAQRALSVLTCPPTAALTSDVEENNLSICIDRPVYFIANTTHIVPYVWFLDVDDLVSWVSGQVGDLEGVREGGKGPEVMGVGLPFGHTPKVDAGPLLVHRLIGTHDYVRFFHRNYQEKVFQNIQKNIVRVDDMIKTEELMNYLSCSFCQIQNKSKSSSSYIYRTFFKINEYKLQGYI